MPNNENNVPENMKGYMEANVNEKKMVFDINEPTNKFYLSDVDSVYVRNRYGEFEISLDGKYLIPAEIDIMWGGLAKEHVEDAIIHSRKMFEELQNRNSRK